MSSIDAWDTFGRVLPGDLYRVPRPTTLWAEKEPPPNYPDVQLCCLDRGDVVLVLKYFESRERASKLFVLHGSRLGWVIV